MSIQTIELDCPPGYPRPDDLIDDVIKGMGLEKKEPVSRVFGNWVWDYSDVNPDKWEEIRPVIKERVSELYNKRTIRYGSW